MSERYKKEIEEILQQVGEAPYAETHFKGQELLSTLRFYVLQSLKGRNLFSFYPGRVILIAVALLISALIINAVGLGFAGLFGWAGLVLFIAGYGLFFIKSPKIEKRWRGQTIEIEGESWLDKVRNKLR